MRPSEILPQYRETIRQLVLEAGMTNPRVFGSVVRGEDGEGSDLDILVDPAPRASLLAMELNRSEAWAAKDLANFIEVAKGYLYHES